MSLLRDIQNDLSKGGVDVTTMLRKCKILAARLGSEEFTRWVDHELNGYPALQQIPGYRRLRIQHYDSFLDVAWHLPERPVPLHLVPEERREAFTHEEFREGIAKACTFMRSEKGAIIHRPELVGALQGKMYPDMNCQSVWGVIPRTEFEQLVSAVQNRVLDFCLKIEAENPDAGEAPQNSHPIPDEKLRPLVQNVFYGSVGNIAQSSEHFTQTATVSPDRQNLDRLVCELTDHLDELRLDIRQKQRAEVQLAALRAELSGDPDPTIVRQAARTIRNVTEGAIGSLVATAVQPSVWHWIQQMLSAFGGT